LAAAADGVGRSGSFEGIPEAALLEPAPEVEPAATAAGAGRGGRAKPAVLGRERPPPGRASELPGVKAL